MSSRITLRSLTAVRLPWLNLHNSSLPDRKIGLALSSSISEFIMQFLIRFSLHGGQIVVYPDFLGVFSGFFASVYFVGISHDLFFRGLCLDSNPKQSRSNILANFELTQSNWGLYLGLRAGRYLAKSLFHDLQVLFLSFIRGLATTF